MKLIKHNAGNKFVTLQGEPWLTNNNEITEKQWRK